MEVSRADQAFKKEAIADIEERKSEDEAAIAEAVETIASAWDNAAEALRNHPVCLTPIWKWR